MTSPTMPNEPGNENVPEVKQEPAGMDDQPLVWQAYRQLLFGLSLPERMLRSTTGMVGGLLRESAAILIPRSFHDSRSYRVFVAQTLDFVTGEIGGVQIPNKNEPPDGLDPMLARKAVGGLVDIAGMATLHVSPLTVLAIVNDLAYGSNTFLKELSAELKQQGIITGESTIDSTADLLAAISETTDKSASVFDLPPLSVDGLRETVTDIRQSLNKVDPTSLLPRKELERLWQDMHQTAAENEMDLFRVGAAMGLYSLNQLGVAAQGALTTVRVSGNLIEAHIFQHYRESLKAIDEKGFYRTVAESSRPYIEAIWYNFSSGKSTVTEELLDGTMFTKALSFIGQWWRPEPGTVSATGLNSEAAGPAASEAEGRGPDKDR